MRWWNPRKRTPQHRQSTPEATGLRVAIGDTEVFNPTSSSDVLAIRLLDEASKKAKGKPAGTLVTVEVADEHPDVHHMELIMSCATFEPEYGLHIQTTKETNNTVTFVKL